ncbi:MAG: efflux transporter outer membrane subunit [Gluconacetobacter diazotrophicus]|nr:efflux transporter outer membrane subunit [Gluconacetobacter diazotrophicus]
MRVRSLLLLLLPLAACEVGPDYAGPPRTAAEAEPGFVRATEPLTVAALPTRADWWRALGDPELDRIEAAALAGAPDLDVARARLREARAERAGARADLLPTTGASALYLHSHGGGGLFGADTVATAGQPVTGNLLGNDFDLYDVGFDASWEADLFGGRRRALEAATARAAVREAELADTQLSLTADVARAYVALRDAQHRLRITESSAALQGRMLDLTRRRAAGGTASALDVSRLDTQLQDTLSEAPPLRAAIGEQLDRLAVLTGQLPGAVDAALADPPNNDPVPLPPATVAIGDPAALLRRRPDIRAAERQVAAANAAIGQRIADYFPKLSVIGNIGFGSADAGSLLSGSNLLAVVAPSLQWKPFDFGRTRAGVDQARAGLAEAQANYRGTVLRAMDDAETALARYSNERDHVRVLERERTSAEHAAALQRERFAGGTASLIDTLDTERERLASEQRLAQAESTLTADFVSLQKSLGLGWTPPAVPAPPTGLAVSRS